VDETDDDEMSWNGSEEDGKVRSECEEMKPLILNIETVTSIGNDR
jgi:hypothetical protein